MPGRAMNPDWASKSGLIPFMAYRATKRRPFRDALTSNRGARRMPVSLLVKLLAT